MSLVASCKESHVEPWAYLRSVIGALPHEMDPEPCSRTSGSKPIPLTAGKSPTSEDKNAKPKPSCTSPGAYLITIVRVTLSPALERDR
ncbi:transposase domain-containing protein [Stieleria tagensis]|uniref:transposase domain-containing protein n=1 Tax=Stieleria tagensis TaxID=2956795 RepID=UPI0036F25DB9